MHLSIEVAVLVSTVRTQYESICQYEAGIWQATSISLYTPSERNIILCIYIDA